MIRTTEWHPVRGVRDAVFAHAVGAKLLRLQLAIDRVRTDGIAEAHPEYSWAACLSSGLFEAAIVARSETAELVLPSHGRWYETGPPSVPDWLEEVATGHNGGMTEEDAIRWLESAIVGRLMRVSP